MIESQILKTIKFFDAQEMPLTALEVWHFLLAGDNNSLAVGISDVSMGLDTLERSAQIQNNLGFYHLPDKQNLVGQRLENYQHGLFREQRILRHAKNLRRLPFVRAVALAGSQAFGVQKNTSDIDLFMITDQRFMFLARFFVTLYFQILGVRRHGRYISNRFCLNHYLAGTFKLSGQSVYTALEYSKLRPILGSSVIDQFKQKNASWMKTYFLNAINPEFGYPHENSSMIQRAIEKIFDNGFGVALERWAKRYQLGRIKTGEYIRVSDTELAFHPDSKETAVLKYFNS